MYCRLSVRPSPCLSPHVDHLHTSFLVPLPQRSVLNFAFIIFRFDHQSVALFFVCLSVLRPNASDQQPLFISILIKLTLIFVTLELFCKKFVFIQPGLNPFVPFCFIFCRFCSLTSLSGFVGHLLSSALHPCAECIWSLSAFLLAPTLFGTHPSTAAYSFTEESPAVLPLDQLFQLSFLFAFHCNYGSPQWPTVNSRPRSASVRDTCVCSNWLSACLLFIVFFFFFFLSSRPMLSFWLFALLFNCELSDFSWIPSAWLPCVRTLVQLFGHLFFCPELFFVKMSIRGVDYVRLFNPNPNHHHRPLNGLSAPPSLS